MFAKKAFVKCEDIRTVSFKSCFSILARDTILCKGYRPFRKTLAGICEPLLPWRCEDEVGTRTVINSGSWSWSAGSMVRRKLVEKGRSQKEKVKKAPLPTEGD